LQAHTGGDVHGQVEELEGVAAKLNLPQDDIAYGRHLAAMQAP